MPKSKPMSVPAPKSINTHDDITDPKEYHFAVLPPNENPPFSAGQTVRYLVVTRKVFSGPVLQQFAREIEALGSPVGPSLPASSQAFTDILQELEQSINLHFEPTRDPLKADIWFVSKQEPDALTGIFKRIAFLFGDDSLSHASGFNLPIKLNGSPRQLVAISSSISKFAKGSLGRHVNCHEILHALGLKHAQALQANDQSPYLPSHAQSLTVMNYPREPEGTPVAHYQTLANGPLPVDIKALQILYGARNVNPQDFQVSGLPVYLHDTRWIRIWTTSQSLTTQSAH